MRASNLFTVVVGVLVVLVATINNAVFVTGTTTTTAAAFTVPPVDEENGDGGDGGAGGGTGGGDGGDGGDGSAQSGSLGEPELIAIIVGTVVVVLVGIGIAVACVRKQAMMRKKKGWQPKVAPERSSTQIEAHARAFISANHAERKWTKSVGRSAVRAPANPTAAVSRGVRVNIRAATPLIHLRASSLAASGRYCCAIRGPEVVPVVDSPTELHVMLFAKRSAGQRKSPGKAAQCRSPSPW